MSVPLPTRLSVALCTFNGARFLAQQLASIAGQSRLPDELVISDDCSTDSTIELLEAFSRDSPFPVRVFHQPTNVGSQRNFEYALRQCTGDLIALADQDDFWLPERLQICEEFLQQHPRAGLVFTDGRLIDDVNAILPKTLWQTFHFNLSLQARIASRDYSVLLRHRFITGATVTLRAAILSDVLPLPASWVHDEWLAAITPFFFDLDALTLKTINYRVHGAQQVGTQRKDTSSAAAHWSHIEGARMQMQELLAHLQVHPPRQHFELEKAYRERAAALDRRSALPSRRISRIVSVVRNLSDYSQHAAGRWSALKDILVTKPEASSPK